MDLLAGASDTALSSRLLAYYRDAARFIDASLDGTPLVFRNFPGGLDGPGIYHLTPFAVSADRLVWAVHAKWAVEFHTWAPLAADADRLRFARILLEPPAGADFARVKLAAAALRDVLAERARLRCVALLDGVAGIALWVPLADAPQAEVLRDWLHRFCHLAATVHPDLVSTEVNTHRDGRVHVHVSSNAPRHFSAAPYSLRAPGLSAVVPVRWDELGAFERADAVGAEAMTARLAALGDVFAAEVAAIGAQRFGDVAGVFDGAVAMAVGAGPRGHIITAAIEILGDGKARTAQQILDEALTRKLVPANTTSHYIYTALFEYIGRQLGRGRKPPIVQDARRLFRINEPPDDWPDVIVPAAQPAEDGQALCDRLNATGSGGDPAAFEAAVCDAFARLGFLTQHLGGHGQPDGIADAILGPLGYRVLLECKTAKTVVTQPDAAEAAKFRETFGAAYCTLVGPDFSNELELLSELQTHQVCAVSVGVLQTLLHIGANADEVRRVLVPGFASDVVGDLLWERQHGKAKRVSTIAQLIVREGWRAQVTAAEQGGATTAPRLTVDAAMLLVDAALRALGSTQACTREEVEAAFSWLTNPVNRKALMDDGAIVLLCARGSD